MKKNIFILISSVMLVNILMPFNLKLNEGSIFINKQKIEAATYYGKNVKIKVDSKPDGNLGILVNGQFVVDKKIKSATVSYSIGKDPNNYAKNVVFSEKLDTSSRGQSINVFTYSIGQQLYKYSDGTKNFDVIKGEKYYVMVIILVPAENPVDLYLSEPVSFTSGVPSGENAPGGEESEVNAANAADKIIANGGTLEEAIKAGLEAGTTGTNGTVSVDPKKIGLAENKTKYTLLAPLPGLKCIDTDTTNTTGECAKGGIGDYIGLIFKILIGLCAALAVIMLIIYGVVYMGDESVFAKTEAKSKMWGAILGLLIALGSYALLNTINPDLLGTKGLIIKQVHVEIVNLPDVGDNTVDPKCIKGEATYSTNSPVSIGVTEALKKLKLKDGWEISLFRVYPSNNRMLIELKKGNEIDNKNVISISPGHGKNNYSELGKVTKNLTPKGDWKIVEVRKGEVGKAFCSKTGSNMGAGFWNLSPTINGERGIGMHGNETGTLGTTNGCLRLTNSDILALLPYIKVGIPVLIRD